MKKTDWITSPYHQARIIPMLKMIAEEGEGLKVLDVGCGDGSISKFIIDLGNEVWGIDMDISKLRKAKKKGIKTHKWDINKGLPYKNNFFDLVQSSRFLEHIYDTEFFLKECARVLKPNGALIITAPNIASFTNRLRIIFGFYPKWIAPSKSWHLGEHIRAFTKSVLKELLEKSGFKVEKVIADFVCFMPTKITNPPWSKILGKIIPSFGETLIAKARKR